ncbi:SdpI family protein [Haloferax namakaokahaiae]|uniref:SdpI family protein n=1 Tax=Haloferax namakaokahaiae TaxID=1748331 RepID=A0ABD5ZFC4_9EURY
MNSTHRFTFAAVLVVLAGALSALAAPMLPAQIVSHWNAAGEPDGTMSKAFGLALLPVLSGALLILFAAIPRIDPYRENISDFRPYYDWFVVIITAFLLVIHAGTIAYNLGYVFDFTALVVAAVAVLFYYAGVLLTHAERNWFVGVRTPWTLSSEEVWTRTHALAGRLFKLTALVSLIGLLFGEYAIYFLLVPALGTAVVTVAYSYYLYERIDHGTDSADTGA